MRKEVKYLDVVVGYCYDGKTIEFLDTKEANVVKEILFKNKHIGISERGFGTIDSDNKIIDSNIKEYCIMINNED